MNSSWITEWEGWGKEVFSYHLLHAHMNVCNKHADTHIHTHAPVHQWKSHSIKLLYPQESDSINEAYLWNQQSGKSYQGQARRRDEGRWRRRSRQCDELKQVSHVPMPTWQPGDEVTRCMLNYCHASLSRASSDHSSCQSFIWKQTVANASFY